MREDGCVCSTQGKVIIGNLKERELLEDLRVDERLILRLDLAEVETR
jgi:hypothetical protein